MEAEEFVLGESGGEIQANEFRETPVSRDKKDLLVLGGRLLRTPFLTRLQIIARFRVCAVLVVSMPLRWRRHGRRRDWSR